MSNTLNSLILELNSFPGHEGRPGEVGGSLPRGADSGGAGGSLEKRYKQFRDDPKTKKAFDAYFKKGAEEYTYEGKYKSMSIEDTITHTLYNIFDNYSKETGPRAKAFDKLQEDLDVRLRMPETVYNIMMKSMHKSAGYDVDFSGHYTKKYKVIKEAEMEKRRTTCHEKLEKEFNKETKEIEASLGKERSWGWRSPKKQGDYHKGTEKDVANEKKLIEQDHLFTKALVDIYYDAVADNYYHNPVG